jgi:hypothetical protein
MGVNPYRASDDECRTLARLASLDDLERWLANAERTVAHRSKLALNADLGTRRAANARARLTTACEARDRYQRAVEIKREEEGNA